MWLKTHLGHVVTSYCIAPLMAKAYLCSLSVEIALNDFRKMGVFSLQSNIFDGADFIGERQWEEYSLDSVQPNGKTFVLPADICQFQKCCQLQTHLAPTVFPVAA